jgi:hypothetical protein
VCRGVTVATHDCCAREGETLLGSDDVYDSLALVTEAEVGDAEILDVVFEGHALEAGVFFFDEGLDVLEGFPGGGWDVLWPLLVL